MDELKKSVNAPIAVVLVGVLGLAFALDYGLATLVCVVILFAVRLLLPKIMSQGRRVRTTRATTASSLMSSPPTVLRSETAARGHVAHHAGHADGSILRDTSSRVAHVSSHSSPSTLDLGPVSKRLQFTAEYVMRKHACMHVLCVQ